MGKRIEKIDRYIAGAEDFAQPILKHLRELVHEACPEVEEGWKWAFPHFMYSGEILCSIAGFKNHCVLTLWKGSLINDTEGVLNKGEAAMGQFGRITSLQDLPSDEILIKYFKEAALLNEKGIKFSKAKPKQKDPLTVPADLQQELGKNDKANATFEGFSYSNKKEYIDWIIGAKTAATRKKRLKTAIEWMEEGKIKNWKYVK